MSEIYLLHARIGMDDRGRLQIEWSDTEPQLLGRDIPSSYPPPQQQEYCRHHKQRQ